MIQTSAITDTLIEFIREIGIPVEETVITTPTFLPGILMKEGSLLVDRSKLSFPGDLLHEAGHIAVMPPSIRPSMSGDLDDIDLHRGGELMAIPWSYAVCLHLGIDPLIVFHEHGYKGSGQNFVENFNEGRYFGVPLLQWCGMTMEPKRGQPAIPGTFPEMIRWMREKE